MGSFRIEHGDCLDLLWREPPCSFDAMVTDPPAAISFMGRDWDGDKGGRRRWIAWLAERMYAAKRALKPGAHALVWALPRTSHWTGMAIEDGGLEIRDCIHHVFGSGMPKSRKLGDGRGTGLKPSHELWFLCRKPVEGTTTANVAQYGTGGLNIDACRIIASSRDIERAAVPQPRFNSPTGKTYNMATGEGRNGVVFDMSGGRWPPNFVTTHHVDCRRTGTRKVKANPTWDTQNRDTEASAFTGAEVSSVRHANESGAEEVPVYECVDGCPVRELDGQSGESVSGGRSGEVKHAGLRGNEFTAQTHNPLAPSYGTASRYFPQFEWSNLDDVTPFLYAAKASRADREIGLAHFRSREVAETNGREEASVGTKNGRAGAGRSGGARNVHPTVKNGELMRYLCRLVAPPRGRVLDIFTGSGSTGVAALLEGLEFVGFELSDTDDEPFVSIARARCAHVMGREFIPRESLRAAEAPKQRSLFEAAT